MAEVRRFQGALTKADGADKAAVEDESHTNSNREPPHPVGYLVEVVFVQALFTNEVDEHDLNQPRNSRANEDSQRVAERGAQRHPRREQPKERQRKGKGQCVAGVDDIEQPTGAKRAQIRFAGVLFPFHGLFPEHEGQAKGDKQQRTTDLDIAAVKLQLFGNATQAKSRNCSVHAVGKGAAKANHKRGYKPMGAHAPNGHNGCRTHREKRHGKTNRESKKEGDKHRRHLFNVPSIKGEKKQKG